MKTVLIFSTRLYAVIVKEKTTSVTEFLLKRFDYAALFHCEFLRPILPIIPPPSMVKTTDLRIFLDRKSQANYLFITFQSHTHTHARYIMDKEVGINKSFNSHTGV